MAALRVLAVHTIQHDTVASRATVATSVRAVEVATATEWNGIVLGLGDPDLRQSFEWGELRRGSAGRPYRYAVLDGETPIAAMAVTTWYPAGWPYPLLYASGGPVIGEAGDHAWAGLRAAACDIAARTNAVLLRVSPDGRDGTGLADGLGRHGFVALPETWTLWNAPRVVMSLDLHPDEATLRRRMRESTRLSLTRLEKGGGRIEVDMSRDGVARLYRLLVAAGRRKGYPVRGFDYFEDLHREYLARGQGYVALARLGDRDLAGVLAVRFGRRAHLLYSSIDPDSVEARKLRAGTGIHWALIRWAKLSGSDVLEWGGAGTTVPPRPENPGYGLYDFKRGFGCTVSQLPAYHDLVFRPRLYPVCRWMETRLAPSLWRFRARLNG